MSSYNIFTAAGGYQNRMMFHLLGQILNVAWIALLVFWLVSARLTKRRAKSASWAKAQNVLIRLGLAILFIAIFKTAGLRHEVMRLNLMRTFLDAPVLRLFDFAVAILGMLFATWARITIGRNWGVPMSLRENHELVTRGPYAWVRHPIYTGLFLALLGTTLFYMAPLSILLSLLISIYYFYAARREESTMLKQFPQQYPEYQKETKMFFPLLF